MNKLKEKTEKELKELKCSNIDKYNYHNDKANIARIKIGLINDEQVQRLLKKIGWKDDANCVISESGEKNGS